MPRIVRFHRFGGPEVLQIDELPEEQPGPGEVRIKVQAFALNRADYLYRHNMHAVTPRLPSRIGYEATGIIDAVGPQVTGFKVGDRVSNVPLGSPEYGVCGESAILPAYTLMPVPQHLNVEEATSIWMQYMTAWGGLISFGDMKAGDAVLITAASSSAGIGAIQLAKDAGALVIATTRTSEKKSFVSSVGADHVIVSDHEDIGARAKELTGGKGVRLVFDCIGGPFLERCVNATAFGGKVILYGLLAGVPTVVPIIPMCLNEVSLHPYSMITIFNDPVRRKAGLNYVASRLACDAFRPVIDRVFAFDEIVDAHRYLEQNNQRGKIVVRT
ncbi:MAG: zinc-dependent alcohol dehydrogenase family protein [Candidatus Acidiferrales bacterium]